jgi:CheY-like chemotaxis protein
MSIPSRPDSVPGAAQKSGPVLVVDNDPTAVELLSRTISREGFQVVTTLSGADVLRLAGELRPFAITLDLDMPDLDGWAVLAALKADPALASIPVIIISTIDERTRGLANGAVSYMVKPVERARLIALLKRLYGPLGSSEPTPAQASPAPPSHDGSETGKPPPKVLIVEDDENNRYLLARSIIRQGWISMEAANGRQALEKLAQSKPNLILLDLEMPELNGFEFIREVDKSPAWRDIPIIVVTALDLTATHRQQLGDAVRKVFLKAHYSRDDLLRELRSQLR